jgi:hypothetical protein
MVEFIKYGASILLVSTVASYAGRKIGITVSSAISVLSFVFVVLIGSAMAVGGFDTWFPVFCLLFPGLAWFGFWLGRFFRNRQPS